MNKENTKIILTEWVYKPNQLISALAYDGIGEDSKFINLSTNKRKIMNILIQAVHNHYESEAKGELYRITLSELKSRTGMDYYSNTNMISEVESMMNVAFETKYKYGFDKFILFTRVKYDGEDFIEFECNKHLNNIIKNDYCLIDHRGDVLKVEDKNSKHIYYSRLNMELESKFRGKEHAKTLMIYEMAVHNINNLNRYGMFMKNIDDLLIILGCPSYANKNSDIINKILIPVVNDLLTVGVHLFYSCELKSNKKIKSIKFAVYFSKDITESLRYLHRKSDGNKFYWKDYPTDESNVFYFKSKLKFEELSRLKLTNICKYDKLIDIKVEDEELSYTYEEDFNAYDAFGNEIEW